MHAVCVGQSEVEEPSKNALRPHCSLGGRDDGSFERKKDSKTEEKKSSLICDWSQRGSGKRLVMAHAVMSVFNVETESSVQLPYLRC